jgi:hypothetical protein
MHTADAVDFWLAYLVLVATLCCINPAFRSQPFFAIAILVPTGYIVSHHFWRLK